MSANDGELVNNEPNEELVLANNQEVHNLNDLQVDLREARIVKELNVRLPKLEQGSTPYEKMANWFLWKSDVIDYFTIKQSINDPRAKLAIMRLEGGNDIKRAMANFYLTEGSTKDIFEQAIDYLEAHFSCGVNHVSLIKKFHEAKQEESESFSSFAQRTILAGTMAGIRQGEKVIS